MISMDNPTHTAHPFAHLGPAPYRLVGVETREDRGYDNRQRELAGQPFTTNLCGGTCDHCGTAIHLVFFFRAADGVRFKVGSSCATKASDPRAVSGTRDYAEIRAQAALRAQVNAAKSALKARKDAAKIDEGKDLVNRHVEELKALPHPRAFAGKTMLDYVHWMFAHAGRAGQLRAIKEVRAALAGAE
jgi:hypothetical protein